MFLWQHNGKCFIEIYICLSRSLGPIIRAIIQSTNSWNENRNQEIMFLLLQMNVVLNWSSPAHILFFFLSTRDQDDEILGNTGSRWWDISQELWCGDWSTNAAAVQILKQCNYNLTKQKSPNITPIMTHWYYQTFGFFMAGWLLLFSICSEFDCMWPKKTSAFTTPEKICDADVSHTCIRAHTQEYYCLCYTLLYKYTVIPGNTKPQ